METDNSHSWLASGLIFNRRERGMPDYHDHGAKLKPRARRECGNSTPHEASMGLRRWCLCVEEEVQGERGERGARGAGSPTTTCNYFVLYTYEVHAVVLRTCIELVTGMLWAM
jgi:hypothetical protein